MYFKNNQHKETFEKLLSKTSRPDFETKCMLYVFSGCQGILDSITSFFDFKNCTILHQNVGYLSSGEKALFKLGLHLFNSENKTDLDDVFYNLDSDNAKMALQAIKMRYKIGDF